MIGRFIELQGEALVLSRDGTTTQPRGASGTLSAEQPSLEGQAFHLGCGAAHEHAYQKSARRLSAKEMYILTVLYAAQHHYALMSI
jgi:hypothetical protein